MLIRSDIGYAAYTKSDNSTEIFPGYLRIFHISDLIQVLGTWNACDHHTWWVWFWCYFMWDISDV